VEAVFQKWGEKVNEYYRNVIDLQIVGGIWHSDDLGFKTGTLLSPEDLEKLLFPWIKKYAQLAHDHDKVCLLHACGNYYENGIIETFIDEIKLDAIHSHQDSIWPISKCVQNFGDRIAFLGGVDLDKLCRLDESSLREYVQEILNACLPGRFALGSGNSIANYVPVENYFVMLDEALRWNSQ
jgi:uroporphyrinogen decarboxylase